MLVITFICNQITSRLAQHTQSSLGTAIALSCGGVVIAACIEVMSRLTSLRFRFSDRFRLNAAALGVSGVATLIVGEVTF